MDHAVTVKGVILLGIKNIDRVRTDTQEVPSKVGRNGPLDQHIVEVTLLRNRRKIAAEEEVTCGVSVKCQGKLPNCANYGMPAI